MFAIDLRDPSAFLVPMHHAHFLCAFVFVQEASLLSVWAVFCVQLAVVFPQYISAF